MADILRDWDELDDGLHGLLGVPAADELFDLVLLSHAMILGRR